MGNPLGMMILAGLGFAASATGDAFVKERTNHAVGIDKHAGDRWDYLVPLGKSLINKTWDQIVYNTLNPGLAGSPQLEQRNALTTQSINSDKIKVQNTIQDGFSSMLGSLKGNLFGLACLTPAALLFGAGISALAIPALVVGLPLALVGGAFFRAVNQSTNSSLAIGLKSLIVNHNVDLRNNNFISFLASFGVQIPPEEILTDPTSELGDKLSGILIASAARGAKIGFNILGDRTKEIFNNSWNDWIPKTFYGAGDLSKNIGNTILSNSGSRFTA